MSKPDISYVRQCFRYCESTGKLFWKERPGNHFSGDIQLKRYRSRLLGREAGNVHFNPKGKKHYIRVSILRSGVFAHHIVWAMKHSEWPKSLDHINGNGMDNRIENLRPAGASDNMKNLKLYSRNKTGVSGVYYTKGRWRVKIRVSGDLIHIGSFNSLLDAVCARKSSERKYGFHENHGRVRPLY